MSFLDPFHFWSAPSLAGSPITLEKRPRDHHGTMHGPVEPRAGARREVLLPEQYSLLARLYALACMPDNNSEGFPKVNKFLCQHVFMFLLFLCFYVMLPVPVLQYAIPVLQYQYEYTCVPVLHGTRVACYRYVIFYFLFL